MIISVPFHDEGIVFVDVAKSIHPKAFSFGWSFSDKLVFVEIDDEFLSDEEKLYLKLKYVNTSIV